MSMYQYLEREQEREIEAGWESEPAEGWTQEDIDREHLALIEQTLYRWLTDETYGLSSDVVRTSWEVL